MALASLDFLRETVFFFKTCFLVALSKALITSFILAAASDFLPSAISFLICLIWPFTLFLIFSLMACFLFEERMALAADLIFGIYFLVDGNPTFSPLPPPSLPLIS